MRLPDRIPKRLRDAAVALPELGEGEGAWSGEDAVEVVESLRGTSLAVSDVVVFDAVPGGYVPSEDALAIVRLPNESDVDYGARSRSAAVAFIRRADVAERGRLFALTFPLWKDAA